MERVNESSCIPKRYKVYYDRKEDVIMRKIILASASPRRKELLERAGVDFEVLPASGDENRISDNPGEAVKQLASDKAASVIRTMKDSADGTIVIGSDTVVVFENVILGKPHDTEDAVNTLKKLQARPAGTPPMPSARSSAIEPVLIATTSVIAAPVSPRRMIDPLPNSFSIWLIAISRLLSLLILFLASLSAMILTPVLFD